jgi:aspartate kinase
MLTIKNYKRPIAAISIAGERSRLTPAVLIKFMEPLSKNKIQIYAISTGEKEIILFVDQAESDKAVIALTETASESSFENIEVRRGLGMVTVSGPELVNTPGILNKLTQPIAKAKINIVNITTAFDSIIFFFDMEDSEKAFKIWENYVPEKMGMIKRTTERIKKAIKRIIPRI